MGGMCLGSLLLPRIEPSRHPLKVYAALEAGIGLWRIVLFGVPLVGQIYTQIAGTGQVGLILRAIVASICLLPPTLLMGATLPAIARWVETTPRGVSWLGYFYGGNLAGAVTGSLLAGFYLLRVYDMPTATVAVALNFVVAGLAVLVPREPAHGDYGGGIGSAAAATIGRGRTVLVYIAIALSGLTALGSEVVWTRVLSLLFGATAYTFSLILAVFLVGLGIGSSLGAALARGVSNPELRSDGCSWVCAWGSRGRRTRPPSRCRIGRSIPRFRRARLVQLPARSHARHLVMLPGRCCGARASHWRSRQWRRRVRTRLDSWAASTRRTPWERS